MFESIIEALKKISVAFDEAIQRIQELFDQLMEDTIEERSIWRPYRCRICGRNYATSAEVRSCGNKHRRQSTDALYHDMAKLHTLKYGPPRIKPRNREATMRPTEIARSKGGHT